MAEQSEDTEQKLSLSLITSLGGNKEDLDLIEDVSDEEESICIKEDFDEYKDEALPKTELQTFIKNLGFNKIKKKLLVIKDDDVDDIEIAESVQKPQNEGDEPPVPKEKKPRGNKFKQNVDKDPEAEIENHAAVSNQSLSKLSDGPPKEHKIRNYMLVKPNRKWFESEIAVDVVHHHVFVPSSTISEYERYALELLQSDICLYKKHQSSLKNRSNFSWIQTVLKSGTSADKMAAYIVLLQDSPVHNLTTLENLIRLVDVKKKRECLLAVDTLKDLFTVDLLLEGRKLMLFDKQPFGSLDQLANGNRDSYDKLLLLWYFESCLKQKYCQFVMALFKMAHDSNLSTKRKAMKTMFDLLSSNPEQEQKLLSNLVNKLGDPHRKIASHCGLLLCRLVDIHPPMKAVLVAEVERLLFRSGISPKAVYYAICFLNQLILNPEDKELAAKLVSVYFSLFKAATKTGEVESKMMSALLTGVNRAFPYAKPEAHTLECHINITYKIVHTTHFNVAVQALMLIYHVLDSKDEFSDRFYSALYRKLFDSELKHSSKQAMFLNLLYKSLKKDPVNNRVHAFLKRILQIAPEQSAGMICGLLFVVSEVLAKSSCKLMLHSKEDLDDEEEKFNDISDEENGESGPGPELRSSENGINDTETGVKTAVESSWVHRINLTQGQNAEKAVETSSTNTYDPLHRNPLFAGAIRTCPWELNRLMHHYHPSVAMFATSLLNSERIVYTGDPLQDFTLIRFLDRFVYRNPKKLSVKGEESSQRAILGRRKHYVPVGAKAYAINTNRFLQNKESAIPVDEKFFYRYFTNLKEMDVKRITAMEEDDEDIESVASDEFEMLLNKFEPGSLKDEYDLDFAAEVKSKSEESKSKKGKGKSSTNQVEEDSDDYEDDNDEEFQFDGDDEFTEAFKDFDDDIADACKSDLEDDFDEDVDFSEEILQKPKGLSTGSHSKRISDQNSDEDETFFTDDDDDDDIDDDDDDDDDNDDEDDSIDEIKPVVKKRKSSKKMNPSELFASAEEFSAILDENIGADKDTIGLEALSNRDNAHVKQLHWEQERDRWIRGVEWRNKLRNKKSKSRKPNGRPVSKGSKRKRK